MACFLVPVSEAVITTITKKIVSKKETENQKISFSEKLGWLNKMLWGGSGLLAFEHIWHGEIIPEFPFLTNAANSADRIKMFHEMATTGVGMSLAVTVVWLGMVSVASLLEKKNIQIMGEQK